MHAPKLYSKNRSLQETDNVYVLENYLHHLRFENDEESILDIGAGDGTFAVEVLLPRLPKRFGKFVGCDISKEMVRYAKKHYESPERAFVQFDIASEDVPPNFEEEFDHIFSFYTMHWVHKQR